MARLYSNENFPIPDETAMDADIESASVVDAGDDFLSEEEINYYMSLGEKREDTKGDKPHP